MPIGDKRLQDVEALSEGVSCRVAAFTSHMDRPTLIYLGYINVARLIHPSIEVAARIRG